MRCLDSSHYFQSSVKIKQLKCVIKCWCRSALDSRKSEKYTNNKPTVCQILLSDQFHTSTSHRFFSPLNTKGKMFSTAEITEVEG